MAAKKKAVRRTRSKSMVSMQELERQLMEQAEQEAEKTQSGGGQYLSIKGKSFVFQGADLGEELEVVIIDWTNEKAYFDVPYNADDPSAPACWALGDVKPQDLIPSDVSVKKQSEDCGSCWANAWGSSENGRGKACRDARRLALISSAQLDDPLEDIEVVFLRTPPTSCRNFDKFANGVRKVLKRPTHGIISTIRFDEEADYEMLLFAAAEPIANPEHLQKVLTLREQVHEDLRQDYDPLLYKGETDSSKGGRKKKIVTKKKAAPRKKGSKFSR